MNVFHSSEWKWKIIMLSAKWNLVLMKIMLMELSYRAIKIEINTLFFYLLWGVQIIECEDSHKFLIIYIRTFNAAYQSTPLHRKGINTNNWNQTSELKKIRHFYLNALVITFT